jgi:hypothetical protein
MLQHLALAAQLQCVLQLVPAVLHPVATKGNDKMLTLMMLLPCCNQLLLNVVNNHAVCCFPALL